MPLITSWWNGGDYPVAGNPSPICSVDSSVAIGGTRSARNAAATTSRLRLSKAAAVSLRSRGWHWRAVASIVASSALPPGDACGFAGHACHHDSAHLGRSSPSRADRRGDRDVTPIRGPVPMRAGGVVRPLSIAGGLPGAYAPGAPSAVCMCCTRFGAVLPIPLPRVMRQRAQYSGIHP